MNNSNLTDASVTSGGEAIPSAARRARSACIPCAVDLSSAWGTRVSAGGTRSPGPCEGDRDPLGLSAPPTSRDQEAGESPEGVLFEDVLPVALRLNQSEHGARPLGLCVRTGRGGANGVTRAVLMRLTDPDDPFFLFQLELLEHDYGAFQKKQELNVGFGKFPDYLVAMLESIKLSKRLLQVSFLGDIKDASSGTLRVIETTPFKTVEHISLTLLREGDVGQKKYLAERFLFFQQAYRRCSEQRGREAQCHERSLEEVRSANARLLEENRRLEDQLRLTSSENEKSTLEALRRVEEARSADLEVMRKDYESKLRDQSLKASELQRELLDSVHAKEIALEGLRGKTAALESATLALQSQLRISENKLRLQEDEVEHLRCSTEELVAFKREATAALSENELNYVSLTERLRSALASLESREGELTALREQYQKQDGYIHILSSQNEQLSGQKRAGEASLEKAHYILSTQIQTIKSMKERLRTAMEQVRSQESLLGERQIAHDRMRDELAHATERLQIAQSKNAELREQLQKTDDAREKLAHELRSSQAALVHLQRSTSVNGRHWGVFPASSNGASRGASTAFGCVSGSVNYHAGRSLAGAPLSSVDRGVGYSRDLHQEFWRTKDSARGTEVHADSRQERPASSQPPQRQPRQASRSPSPDESSQKGDGAVQPNAIRPKVMMGSSPDQRSSAGLTAASRNGSSSPLRGGSEEARLAAKSFFSAPVETALATVAGVANASRPSAYF